MGINEPVRISVDLRSGRHAVADDQPPEGQATLFQLSQEVGPGIGGLAAAWGAMPMNAACHQW
jgi:hypothetical protein